MDSSWKNLQIRMEAAWNMRTTPKTKRPKTGDIISSAHSLDWNKKKVRQLQQQWNDEVTKLVADRNKAISDVMVDILTLIRMDIKSASSVLISHEAAKLLWEKAYEYGHANGFTDVYCAIENYEEVVIEALKGKEKQYRKEIKTMTFNNAKNLHNEDEVTIKETGEHMCVLDAYENPNNPKQVLIECDDGNTYTHHEIK